MNKEKLYSSWALCIIELTGHFHFTQAGIYCKKVPCWITLNRQVKWVYFTMTSSKESKSFSILDNLIATQSYLASYLTMTSKCKGIIRFLELYDFLPEMQLDQYKHVALSPCGLVMRHSWQARNTTKIWKIMRSTYLKT